MTCVTEAWKKHVRDLLWKMGAVKKRLKNSGWENWKYAKQN